MKNVLFLPSYSFGTKTGPSISKPNWFWRSGATGAVGLRKYGRASRASLRKELDQAAVQLVRARFSDDV
jgi:hypothetical protein